MSTIFTPRQLQVLQLGEKGKTVAQVAAKLGISQQRAREIYREANFRQVNYAERPKDDLPRLSVRAANILGNCNITTAQQLRAALERGEFVGKNWKRNCGIHTYRELCKAAGIQPLEFFTRGKKGPWLFDPWTGKPKTFKLKVRYDYTPVSTGSPKIIVGVKTDTMRFAPA